MKLKISGVVKDYDKRVLDGVSIEIERRSAVAVIGPSGCGKSTLLRLIAGIEFPQQGQIEINGTKITPASIQQYQKTIGVVFQDHNLFPHLSLEKNITIILEKIHGMKKEDAEKRADELLNLLHLSGHEHKLPAKVSGGQAQRASIARALSTNPDLLLLDEPTASLDPVLTHEVLTAIQELKTLGKDFIFVTHEIAFVKSFADYVIFIDEGNIIEHGGANILNNPATKKLQAFLKNVTYGC